MKLTLRPIAAILLCAASLPAAVFTFDSNPFAGSTALTTPGRQVVGGEPFIVFNIATDIFAFDPAVFNIGNAIAFANDIAANLPTGGVNVIVLQSFDNDNDPGTPFNAGTAANLIAAQITSPGAGFFIYFNQGLDLARLVYSTDLNDNTSDLKIIARLTNLSGQPGRDAFPTFTASNFTTVPEPATFGLVSLALAGLAVRKRLRAPARR
ncbi:MAG: PEP-CTERM sorting domain-containing protein [Bryobacteraceae bacterium]